MKQRIVALLTAAMLACAPCVAEEAAPYYEIIPAETQVEMDLDGDGAAETLFWHAMPLNEYDEQVRIEITESTGEKAAQWESGMLWGAQLLAAELNGDGVTELFLSGDQMSDDYVTFCLNYDGALALLPFADANRGENIDGYFETGYGRVTALGGNRVALSGTQDILGTYMATRIYALADGQFSFADDGLWVIERDASDPETWEYGALTLAQDVTAVVDGAETTLAAGQRVLITGGDKTSAAYFLTEDGLEGTFTLEPDPAAGYGSIVNGVPENDLFEFVPYAD